MNSHEDSFKDNGDFCLKCFVLLGNYFALFGLSRARRARELWFRGDIVQANACARQARRWGLYGLLVSTPLNAAVFYGVFILLMRLIEHFQEKVLF